MVPLIPWVERRWSFDLPVGAFPAVLERLRGTSARAAALVAGVPERILAARPNRRWSAKDHIGHLSDLSPLDMKRVDEFLAGAALLTAADMTNRRTADADHRSTPIGQLLRALDDHRRQLVLRLENATAEEIASLAIHPRLGVRMRLIDWAQFVADHDDHHLTSARIVLRGVDGRCR